MIIDRIGNAKLYSKNKHLAKALEYLAKTDFQTLPAGSYELDGRKLYAGVGENNTRQWDAGALFEAHRKYIDVQYIVSGIEKMGYAPIDHLQVVTPYDETKDAEMLKGTGDFLTAQPGMFLVFFPHDAHMPGLAADQPMKVKKVVVKIAV